jgi:hypothetical protein
VHVWHEHVFGPWQTAPFTQEGEQVSKNIKQQILFNKKASVYLIHVEHDGPLHPEAQQH